MNINFNWNVYPMNEKVVYIAIKASIELSPSDAFITILTISQLFHIELAFRFVFYRDVTLSVDDH